MKNRLSILFLVLAVGFADGATIPVKPITLSLSPTGLLICSNLTPGTAAAVAGSTSLTGPWLTNLSGLNAITVPANGSIRVNVPVNSHGMAFYRLLGVPAVDAYAGMTLISAGSFTMGDSVHDGLPDALPTNIDVSSFYIDTNLVSYSQWLAIFAFATNIGYQFDDSGSAKNNASNQPVQAINWYDAVKWCNARSQNAGLTPVYYTDSAFTHAYTNGDTDAVYPNWTANGYQLPTEAQWEKAARGGLSGQRFPWGNTISGSQANYDGNTEQVAYDMGPDGYNTNFDSGAQPFTSPVGSFPPNGYGLYDMAGNLFEWCWDWYGTPYGQPTTNNPTGPSNPPDGTIRVIRGGYWGVYASFARVAYRNPGPPTASGNYIGFRCGKNP